MHPFLLAALGRCTASVCAPVDAYVAAESPIAKAGALANIGPSGALSSGAYVSPLSLSAALSHATSQAS